MDHGQQISRRTTIPLLLVHGLALVGLSVASCGNGEKTSDLDGGLSVLGASDGAGPASPHTDATADVISTVNDAGFTGIVAISVSGLGAVGFNYTQGSYITGFVFRANTAISITQFGYYDSNLTGGVETFQSHAVGLYDLTTHTLLGSATVQPSDPMTGLFHYVSLTNPIAINTTDTFAIVGVTGTNKYTVGITASEAPVNAALTYVSGAGYGPSNNNATMTSTLVEPNAFDAGNIFGQPTPTGTLCDFGPNFMFVTKSGGNDASVDAPGGSPTDSAAGSDGSTAMTGGATGGTTSTGGSSGTGGSTVISCDNTPATGGPTDASVPGSGCADGTRDGLLDAVRFPGVAACAGGWTGTVDQAQSLCANGWHVCTGVEPAIGAVTYYDGLAFHGCFAFDAAQDNWACHPGCNASVAAGVDSAQNIDMAGLGADCPFQLSGGSCIACGRIDASENSGTGCNYYVGLTGVVCCQ
jgi:hypothetical protein